MSEYLQAVSTLGYKVHAVPAGAERFGPMSNWSHGKPVCGIRGRDASGVSNMRLLTYHGGEKRAFSRNAEDYLPHARICTNCTDKLFALGVFSDE